MAPSVVPPLSRGGRPMPTKVVVRLLPSSLAEDEFIKSIPEEFTAAYDYIRFVAGKTVDRPTPDNPNENARCYLNFHHYTAACDFVNKFHGKVFTDQRNEQYRAVVALAPYQRIPKPWKQLKNLVENTIEDDDQYKQFLSQGDGSPEKLLQKPPSVGPTVAPLVHTLMQSSSTESQRSKQSKSSNSKEPKPPPAQGKQKPAKGGKEGKIPKEQSKQNKKPLDKSQPDINLNLKAPKDVKPTGKAPTDVMPNRKATTDIKANDKTPAPKIQVLARQKP